MSATFLHAGPVFVQVIGGVSADYAYSVDFQLDGGLAVAGYTGSYGTGNYDALLCRFDPGGSLLWTKTLGGSSADQAYDLVVMPCGSMVICGGTGSFGAVSTDFLVARFSPTGSLRWTKVFGGIGIDYGYSICDAGDNGIVIAGSSSSYGAGGYDFLVMRLDSAGGVKWVTSVGGTNNDYAYAVMKEVDGFTVVGTTYSFGVGGSDLMVTRLDPDGNQVWTWTAGGPGNENGYAVASDGQTGYTVIGSTTSYGAGGEDILLIQVQVDTYRVVPDTPVAMYVMGGSGDERGYSASWQGNRIFVAGPVAVSGGNWEFGLVRYDLGTESAPAFLIRYSDEEKAMSVAKDDGYAVAGYTRSQGAGDYDLMVARYDTAGITCIVDTVTLMVYDSTPPVTVQSATASHPSPTVISPSGMVTSPSPAVDTLCFVGTGESGVPGQAFLRARADLVAFYLPGAMDARLSVFDVSGRLVARPVDGRLGAGEHELIMRGLVPGVYFLELKAGADPGLVLRAKTVIR